MPAQVNPNNTLIYDPALCIGCGMCSTVCPHGVFAPNGRVAQLVRAGDCIECGACQRNCPTDAIRVDVGVGCAAALMWAALTGREASCGPTSSGCGDSGADCSSTCC